MLMLILMLLRLLAASNGRKGVEQETIGLINMSSEVVVVELCGGG